MGRTSLSDKNIQQWKLEQIERQTIFKSINQKLYEYYIDFIIDNGDFTNFLSQRIANLTISEKEYYPMSYICCTVPYHLFDVAFNQFGQKYPKDYVKTIYVSWTPKTLNTGYILEEALKECKKLKIPYPITNSRQFLRIDLASKN